MSNEFKEACDPEARKDYVLDFKLALRNVNLDEVEWSVEPSGPTIDGTDVDIKKATFFFSGGTSGTRYTVKATATREDESGWVEIVRVVVRCEET